MFKTFRKASNSSHIQRGQDTEARVIEALKAKGWELVESNFRICGVQVDALMRHPDLDLALFEIKTISDFSRADSRVRVAQITRLSRACEALSAKYDESVTLLVAMFQPQLERLEVFDALGESLYS